MTSVLILSTFIKTVFSASCWEAGGTSLPVVFWDAISSSFLKYWNREMIFITHFFLAYF